MKSRINKKFSNLTVTKIGRRRTQINSESIKQEIASLRALRSQ